MLTTLPPLLAPNLAVPAKSATPAYSLAVPVLNVGDDSFSPLKAEKVSKKLGEKPQLGIAKTLQRAMSQENGDVSYLSAYTNQSIPEIFVGKEDRQQLITQCSAFIRQFKQSPLLQGQNASHTFTLADHTVTVTPVNFSSDGALLKLDLGGQLFGLKIYDYAVNPSSTSPDARRQGIESAYQDAAVGFYLNSKNVPNVVRLEAINPDEGWALQEHIRRNGVHIPRDGASLASLINEGMIETPEIHDKNCYRQQSPDGSPYDMVVELSALRFQPETASWETFLSRLQQADQPEKIAGLTPMVFGLPENKRLAAFETLLANPDPQVRHAGISAMAALPAKDVETAIDSSIASALAVPAYRRDVQKANTQLMRTAVRIFLLPSPDAQWRKFQELLAYKEPYTALGLGAAIPCLPREHQFEAVQQLVKAFPKPVTLPMPGQPFLKQSCDPREYLFEELQNLPPETFAKASRWMAGDKSLHPFIQKALWYFDEPVRQQIFSVLQSNEGQ